MPVDLVVFLNEREHETLTLTSAIDKLIELTCHRMKSFFASM